MGRKRNVSDLKEADLKGKTVFLRADLNVPQVGIRCMHTQEGLAAVGLVPHSTY